MLIPLEEWLAHDGALVAVWRAILWLSVGYLLALGVAALAWPSRARSFLEGFAGGWRSNLVEAMLRALAGLAFIGAASTTRVPELGRLAGLFLVATAVLMALVPRIHALIARPATSFVTGILPVFGLLSIALAWLAVWFII